MRTHLLLALPIVGLLSGLTGCVAPTADDGEDPNSESDALKQCAAGPTVKGVDVSSWQGTVNWTKVKAAGISFAIARVSDGESGKDSQFHANWHGIKAAGMVRGSYQFFRPGQDPIKQADYLLERLEQEGGMEAGDLAPTLDLEVTDGMSHATIISRAKAWLDHIQKKLGRTPMVYTAPGFYDQLGNPSGFSKETLWVANWETSCPTLPTSWSHWSFWQHADNGHVNGISGNVDLDTFNGSLSDLHKFAGAPSTGGSTGGSTSGSSTAMPSLGGKVAGNPVAARNADGRLEVFARGTNGDVVTAFQNEDNGSWSTWYSVGGKVAGDPSVVANKDGSLELFARGSDDSVWHAKQDGANGKVGAWAELPADVKSDPVAAKDHAGKLEVFVAGTDGWMYHASESTPGSGWSKWSVLGSFVGTGLEDPRVVAQKDGTLAVFARSKKDESIHVIQQKAAGGWTDWKSLGGKLVEAVAATRNHDGRLEIFGRGTDGALWHDAETTVGGSWTGWKSLGGDATGMAVAADTDGRIEVFARGKNDDLYRIRQKTAGGAWEAWVSMKGAMAGKPAAGSDEDGRVEVFVRVASGAVEHEKQSKVGTW